MSTTVLNTETTPATPEGPTKAAITLGNLKHALKTVGMAIERAATIPVLQCVRMEQIATGLALEATSLDLYIRVVLQELGGPDKPIITPAEKFTAWVKLLTGGDVKISADAARAKLQCGRATVTLPLMAASNWPSNTVYDLKADGVTLTQGSFARALRFASIAVGEDPARPALNGILVEGDGTTLRLVAVDGFRLTMYTLPCSEKINVLLPSKLVKALIPLLTDEDGGVDLTFDANTILASVDADTRVLIASARLVAQFPNWQAVMPNDKRVEITVNVAELLASLERALLLTDKDAEAIEMTIGDQQITIAGASAQNGEALETIEYRGEYKSSICIRFNGYFLLDLVKKLSGDLRIAVPSSNQKPMLFKATPHEGETLDYIIMPMMKGN